MPTPATNAAMNCFCSVHSSHCGMVHPMNAGKGPKEDLFGMVNLWRVIREKNRLGFRPKYVTLRARTILLGCLERPTHISIDRMSRFSPGAPGFE